MDDLYSRQTIYMVNKKKSRRRKQKSIIILIRRPWFSNLTLCLNYLLGLLKHRALEFTPMSSWFSWYGWWPGTCLSDTIFRDLALPDPGLRSENHVIAFASMVSVFSDFRSATPSHSSSSPIMSTPLNTRVPSRLPSLAFTSRIRHSQPCLPLDALPSFAFGFLSYLLQRSVWTSYWLHLHSLPRWPLPVSFMDFKYHLYVENSYLLAQAGYSPWAPLRLTEPSSQ